MLLYALYDTPFTVPAVYIVGLNTSVEVCVSVPVSDEITGSLVSLLVSRLVLVSVSGLMMTCPAMSDSSSESPESSGSVTVPEFLSDTKFIALPLLSVPAV